MDAFLFYVFIFLLTLLFFHFVIKITYKDGSQKRAKLPPGSMGWPYIGETLQLYSQDPNTFFASKQKRYGEIFKTHILGCPSVMLASPEAAKFVLVTEAHLFKPSYPKSKERLIGPSALFFHQGDYHGRLRKLVQGSLSLDAIRNLVPDIEAAAISASSSWANGQVINTFHEMKKLSFEVGILSIFGHLESNVTEELKKNYSIVDKGYNSFPTNIPGTLYKKALLAREKLSKILSDIIWERKEKKLVEKDDLLGCFLNSKDEKGEVLSDDQIADNIIGVLFAAQDTTASVMTWVVKFLHDEPKLLEAVKSEQKEIRRLNEENKQPLTWRQTRNMPISYKVVLESLRVASIISFTFREAVADVEYKGYLIPKGWKVMPLFRNIHHNPEFFSQPQKFDPSRFEVSPKPNTFMPFGSGTHACPGNELAKLEILIMLHHLVTNFRWEIVGPESGVQYSPFPVPHNGLPVRFWRESITTT
ncbi:abscisic acid 8'-hydroxylase CYP707A1-like [Humulus lupulus]|uniref:abscisic acid 8'-hydroxylase CYP707A1-like n=1 Tax=Humulus lupulus TaxID=3486 RepID=UPI002B4069BF|nr:abscisic acid 8'-hydroxylase CYP707A1-like [Humulus lupulus]